MESIKLNNGIDIPIVGLGTFLSANDEVYNAVLHALKNGYTHIDTAAIYGNEEGVGQAISDSGIKRENIFLTTKLWNAISTYEATIQAFEESATKLKTEYIDMYLIHWPGSYSRISEVWKVMEDLHDQGRIKSIGVSNFNVHHLEHLISNSRIKPSINQIECNVKIQNHFLVEYCAGHEIAVQAYSPMRSHRINEVLENNTLQTIGKKYSKSPVQVAIRWLIDRNIVVLPKSTNPQRIDENINVFDFKLDGEDMKLIRDLNNGMRLFPEPDNVDYGFSKEYSLEE